MELGSSILINSPNVKYSRDHIEADYEYSTSAVEKVDRNLVVTPVKTKLKIRTNRKVPKVGVMLIGWGGNNGCTFTAGVLANKYGISWDTKDGKLCANWYGSITQSSTVWVGTDPNGEDVYCPMSQLVPMLHPDDIEIDGWDISSMNLAGAMERARVIDYNLQKQLKPHMESMKPRPSPYYPDYIAANQSERADNVMNGTKWEQLNQIRKDIRSMKQEKKVDKVIVFWTANTERYSSIIPGVNDTADNLLAAVKKGHSEISPSTLFAIAAILESSPYINGSPQNTFVPGCIELAERHGVFIGGDDLKSGQTKLKSVLVDFLVSAGIKPVSIASYNHLGNNDGKNLSAPAQFKSKEISKSCVVDDVVASNNILYKSGEKIDHTIVIKYVPYVGDSKRAMDEYVSQLMFGGHNTLAIHNTCEDSLLAAPIMLDLIILSEIAGRIEFCSEHQPMYTHLHPVLSLLSYLCKAPLVPPGAPVINSLNKQRACLENVLRACIGLPPDHNMALENKLPKSLFAHVKNINHLNNHI